MANIEGIIFSDLFIQSKDQFINFFINHYNQNQQKIDNCINDLTVVLTEYKTKNITVGMAEHFKKAWDNFEHIVMLNQNDLELIVAYRGQSGKNGQFSEIIRQADVEGTGQGGTQYGINAGHDLVKDSIKALQASQIEQFLQFHLNGLLNQLESSISRHDASILHKYHTAQLNASFQQNSDLHLTGVLWREAFYGGGKSTASMGAYYYSGRGLGKAYDAYMNHMANKETGIFNYLRSGGAQESGNIAALTKRDTTVFIEEGGIGPGGNFPQLIKDSTNHTGWYTGGDIIIVNPQTMAVVYNIQLKTTTANKPSVFGERVEKIRNFLKGFQELTPEQKAEKIYDFMLTSISNKDDFQWLPQEEVEDLVKRALEMKGLKINVNI